MKHLITQSGIVQYKNPKRTLYWNNGIVDWWNNGLEGISVFFTFKKKSATKTFILVRLIPDFKAPSIYQDFLPPLSPTYPLFQYSIIPKKTAIKIPKDSYGYNKFGEARI